VVTLYDVMERETKGLQALDGLLLATRRETALRLGFDEATFDGWHLYDLDFSLRAAQAGLDCATCNDILVVHGSQAATTNIGSSTRSASSTSTRPASADAKRIVETGTGIAARALGRGVAAADAAHDIQRKLTAAG